VTSAATVDGVVVVPGGTGNVGEGIARAFLEAGATVVVPSRSKERLAELAERVGAELAPRLHGIPAGYATFAEADELAERIGAEHGRIDHVVPSIGGWWMGKALWQTSEAEWQQYFVDTATAHLAVARTFVPRLEPGGSFTIISGFSAQRPYPSAGIVSMQGAALLMMREVLSAELNGQRRVNDLVLGPIITRSRPNGSPEWLTADHVGQAAVLVAKTPTIHDEHIILDTRTELAQLLRRAPAGERA
jgi:NAD(P)-dependent dehydrogenase (short-subunit alcohol dehydrogenase family)